MKTQKIQPTKFQKWLITFCEEKQIDMSEFVKAGDGSELQIGDVCSAIMNAPEQEQAGIQKMLIQIDFKNGDVAHYLRHLAQALNSSHKVGI